MRSMLAMTLAAVTALAAAVSAPGTARADDPLAGLTPMSSGSLGGVTVQGNFFTSSNTSNKSNQVGNVVGADRGGKVINGAIESNTIANNRGLTSVMMNTGNNVSFNNAMVVNIILPPGVR